MQIKKWTAAAIGAVLAIGAAGTAVAHHSFATEFVRNKPIRLQGKVVKFDTKKLIGLQFMVDAFRARDGDTRASAAEIRVPNGRELSLGNPTTEAVAAAAARARD